MFGLNRATEKRSDPSPSNPSPPAIPSERDLEKADFHIKRFQDAISQCQKGEERIAELRRHLRYWEAVKSFGEVGRP